MRRGTECHAIASLGHLRIVGLKQIYELEIKVLYFQSSSLNASRSSNSN